MKRSELKEMIKEGLLNEGSRHPKLYSQVGKFNDAYHKLDKQIEQADSKRGPDDYEIPSLKMYKSMRIINDEIKKLLGYV